jgi:alkaline phosphatase
LYCAVWFSSSITQVASAEDHIRKVQTVAIENGSSPVAHWGWNKKEYSTWTSHTNRLIPLYTFGTGGAGPGIDLDGYLGTNSKYRDRSALEKLYGLLPRGTLCSKATYCDQTDVFNVQKAALDRGMRHIVLIIFDGMDWQTTRAAAIYKSQTVSYREGRGSGMHFQNYSAAGTSQFGYMVTSPFSARPEVDVNQQLITRAAPPQGGYDPNRGGFFPWSDPTDQEYLIGEPADAPHRHLYTDSAGSATSMTCGVKTYNGAVGVDRDGRQVPSIAHLAQARGFGVGVVSSVPISHATPATGYGHNVSRNDYQDLSRDLLGLPSISHAQPLIGLDVVAGGGAGIHSDEDALQGENFVPGNTYVTAADLHSVDVKHGGKYVVARRQAGVDGSTRIQQAANLAARNGQRLLAFYGIDDRGGHLPFQTADGDYQPAPGQARTAEVYSAADIHENPTLAEMTTAALTVLQTKPNGFWLLIEAGDVDWANHDNNLDNSIGAVNSGDKAFQVITRWVEEHSNWKETLVILTADHGHYMVLDRPHDLVRPQQTSH